MTPRALLAALDADPVVVLPPADLDALLDAAEVLSDQDTSLCGRLRLLRLEDRYVLQEQHPDGRFLARLVDSEAVGAELVTDRLETYERMWDGCGCRVDYGV